jgi:hypothetical protein
MIGPSGGVGTALAAFTRSVGGAKYRCPLLRVGASGSMPNPSVKLLLSCVSGEFGEHRDALRRALTRPNVEVKIQEDFKALGGDTLNMLEEYVEQCEAVVHFVGDMAGSTPAASSVDDLLRRRPELEARLAEKGLGRDALKSLTYTQWEAWLAIGLDKNLLIVQPAESVARGPDYSRSDASRAAQAQHLDRLRAIATGEASNLDRSKRADL